MTWLVATQYHIENHAWTRMDNDINNKLLLNRLSELELMTTGWDEMCIERGNGSQPLFTL